MAHIVPFRALRYDPQRVDPAAVVTQPYDKITPESQDRYYAASPYNLVRLILGKHEVTDNDQQNVYARAATFFSDWRRQGVFLQDPQPSLYVYSQRFTVPGGTKELKRQGFIGLGRLEDYSAGIVFRHEQTLAKPKADRLELLRATRAHFGQLFMLYQDGGEVESLLRRNDPPDIEVRDEYGVLHQVWRVSDPGIVSRISAAMAERKLIIADGHHRYETALNYRNEQRAALAAVAAGGTARERSRGDCSLLANSGSDAPYEFAMMTFINMGSPGLVILPTHRVVHGMSSFSAERLQSGAR